MNNKNLSPSLSLTELICRAPRASGANKRTPPPNVDSNQGVANINFRYERIFKYIYIQKTIRMNIRIYSYQKNDTNEYPNIFAQEK